MRVVYLLHAPTIGQSAEAVAMRLSQMPKQVSEWIGQMI